MFPESLWLWLVVLLGVLCCAWAWVNHRAARRAERAHPPSGKFIDVDGVRLHYLEHGSGAPVVLLHGNNSTCVEFVVSTLFDLAAAHHRVIAFDRPGYGYSTRPRPRFWTPAAQAALFLKALERLGVRDPVIVGHSWGALVAAAMALAPASPVRGLVLMSGFFFPVFRLDVLMLSVMALPAIGQLMRHTMLPAMGRAATGAVVAAAFAPSLTPDSFGEIPMELSLRPSQLRASMAETALMTPCAYALSRRYARLSQPTVILAAEGDRIVDTPTQSARLHGVIPQSEYWLLKEGGHMPHHLNPRKALDAIERVSPA